MSAVPGNPNFQTQHVADLVRLCGRQVSASVDDATSDIDALVTAFLRISQHVSSVIDTARALANRHEDDDAGRQLEAEAAEIQQAVQSAISSFQLGDRLNQRLGNVCRQLIAVSRILEKLEHGRQLKHWERFLRELRRNYTLEEERRLFDAVFPGMAEPVDCKAVPTGELFDTETADE